MKLLIILLSLILSFSFKSIEMPRTTGIHSIMSLSEYQDIKEEDIKEISMIRYTEAGDSKPIKYETKSEISAIYNNLKSITYSKETTIACEDNTTVYTIILKDGTKKTIEFECEVLVLKDRRLLIN